MGNMSDLWFYLSYIKAAWTFQNSFFKHYLTLPRAIRLPAPRLTPALTFITCITWLFLKPKTKNLFIIKMFCFLIKKQTNTIVDPGFH